MAFNKLVLACFACVSLLARAQYPEKMNNIGYLAGGYHIYYGNPRATQAGVDPGFTTHAGPQIFEQSYSDRTTGDGRYLVPDGFSILSNAGCRLAFSAKSTFKSSEYSQLLQTDVSANFGAFGVAFSASTDYKHFEKQTKSSNQKVVQSTVDCTTYSASRSDYARASFTRDFELGLASLPANYGDGSAYFDLFDRFGTHVLAGAVLGSRFGFTSYFSEENWKHVENTGVNVTVAAQYEGIVKAGGSISVGKEHDAQQAFHENADSFELITLGSKPVSGDEKDWARAVIDEPMPIHYTLDPICDVIAAASVYKANCERAALAGEYCAKRLRDRGDVKECVAARENECLWHVDCSPNQICNGGKCEAPTQKGNVQPIERFWDWKRKYPTFHFAPPQDYERVPRSGAKGDMFFAFSAPAKDSGNTEQHTVPINHYLKPGQGGSSTYHPAPASSGEVLVSERVFYAYAQPAEGTTPINRYYGVHSNVHPAPSWPGEHSTGDGLFHAFRKSPACSAHSKCGSSAGDCCPAADGTWLRCCDNLVTTLATNDVEVQI